MTRRVTHPTNSIIRSQLTWGTNIQRTETTDQCHPIAKDRGYCLGTQAIISQLVTINAIPSPTR
eukprot:scaffold41729_cov76-Phaeocystis_antarctica.AAC.2